MSKWPFENDRSPQSYWHTYQDPPTYHEGDFEQHWRAANVDILTMQEQLSQSRPELKMETGNVGPRIAYFTESLPPLVDGVSRTLGQLFDFLQARGQEFRIYSPVAKSHLFDWSRRTRRLASMPFPFLNGYRVSLPNTTWLAADLDRFQPDLICVSCPGPAGVWAQSYARSRRIPVVGTFHTHFADYLRYFGFSYLSGPSWHAMRWFYNRGDVTFAPSQATLRELGSHGFRNLRLWGRGVDYNLFTPERRSPALRFELGADEQTPLVLLVSRLVKEKDLADLVHMDRILRQRGFHYQFALVGDGAMRATLKVQMPNVHFPGKKTGTELASWYASADIFVFPSTTETFGNVVQEAMASGLPTVVVDGGAPASIIAPGVSGLIARAKDPIDLADKVELLLVDSELRREMGRRGRELALQRGWSEVNLGLLSEYEAIVAKKTRVRQGNRR